MGRQKRIHEIGEITSRDGTLTGRYGTEGSDWVWVSTAEGNKSAYIGNSTAEVLAHLLMAELVSERDRRQN